MIWTEAVAQDAPVVEESWQETGNEPFQFCPEDSAPHPSRLRAVNQEAAEVYLKGRIPLLPCVPTALINDWIVLHGRYFVAHSLPEPQWQDRRKLFFNPKVDTVYISNHSTMLRSDCIVLQRLQSVPNLQQLRSLACDWLSFEKIDEALSGRVQQMLEFPALEQLLVLKRNKGWRRRNQRGKFKEEVNIVVRQRRSMNLIDIPNRISGILDQRFPERTITVGNGDAVRVTWY